MVLKVWCGSVGGWHANGNKLIMERFGHPVSGLAITGRDQLSGVKAHACAACESAEKQPGCAMAWRQCI